MNLDETGSLDLREFADLLDRILAGSIPAYVSLGGAQRIKDVGIAMGGILCDKSNGLNGVEQIMAATMMLASVLRCHLRNLDFVASPAGRVQ